jgi:hypothetical protein
MHRILIWQDIRLTYKPDIRLTYKPDTGYLSGEAGYRISGSTYRLIVKYKTPAIFIRPDL